MAVFKFVISHAKQSVQVEKDQKDAPIIGKKLGETLSGDFLGLVGYELQITGGSDKDGFPMRKDVDGQMRKKQMLTKGLGFWTDVEGKRKRRVVRGNTVAADIAQVNCKVVKAGDKGMFELLGITPKEPKAKVKGEAGNEKSKMEDKSEIKEEKKEEPAEKAEAKDVKEEKKEVSEKTDTASEKATEKEADVPAAE